MPRLAPLAVVMLAAGALAIPAAPVAAAPGCKVTNTTTHVTKASLQASVDAAAPRQTLQVRGTCVGSTTIGKRLGIVGVRSKALGKPTLAGPTDVPGRVLTISPATTVNITGLTVTGGDVSAQVSVPEATGGGIRNEGRLTLTNVVVSGNKARYGGGIVTTGPLTLAGTTRLTGNSADSAGGLFIDGPEAGIVVVVKGKVRIDHNEVLSQGAGIGAQRATIRVSGASQIDHNTATGSLGGGIAMGRVTLAMSGTSRIHHNTANGGGGISADDGTVVLKDHTQVDHNTAGSEGGGISIVQGSLTMNGASSVHHNGAPDMGGIALTSGGPFENRMTMNGTSAVFANTAGAAGAVIAVLIEGDLVMNDRSVIRDHHSDIATRGVQVFKSAVGGSPSVKMTGKSRIRNNTLAAGYGALVLFPDCGSVTTTTGVAKRVVHNTPANVVSVVGC